MENEMLSQDLFWDEEISTSWSSIDMSWMIPEDEETEENTESDEESEIETTENEEIESEWELDLSDIESAIDEVWTSIEDAQASTEESKATIESVTSALDEDNKEEARKLIEELYTQVLQSEADLEWFKTKYDVLNSKFQDISKQLEESKYKVEELSTNKISSDPKIKIINRMYDDAKSWSETAKKKVTSLIEDMYYELTWETLEEKEVNEALKDTPKNSNNTSTKIEIPEEEEVDESLYEWTLWIF